MCFFKWVFSDCPTKWGKMFQAMDPRASLVSKVSRKKYFSILSFLRSFLSLISKWAVALLFSNVLVNLKLSKISLDENSGRLITAILVQKLSLIQNRFIAIVEPQRLSACTRLRRKRGGVVPWRSNRKKEPTPAMQGFACLIRSVPVTQRRELLLPLGVDCDCTNTSVTIFLNLLRFWLTRIYFRANWRLSFNFSKYLLVCICI